MPHRLHTGQKDFAEAFRRFLRLREEKEASVAGDVAAIIADVRARDDAAALEYTKKFDRVDYTTAGFRASTDDIMRHASACLPEVVEALELAAERIREYHVRQMPDNLDFTDAAGVRLGAVWGAISDVGMYVPGGMASYPSSVLMNAIPAKVAGVKRLAMAVPTPQGEINPAVMAAAMIARVDEVYFIGGAQAVAAMAYGTETIAPVRKIVGPGNAYVAEAKRQVFGTVGIDMIAGPSEILVVSDNKSNPAWIAADLLSQAEHDASAQAILITDDAGFAEKVEKEIETSLATLPRGNIAAASWENYGGIIVVETLAQAIPLINAVAPEHLELAMEEPAKLVTPGINAGAIFMGRYTPEAIGDYLAGPSHVLPTSRTAAFSSGLSVYDFLKRSSVIACSESSLAQIGAAAATLADAEGLSAHALSIRLRL